MDGWRAPRQVLEVGPQDVRVVALVEVLGRIAEAEARAFEPVARGFERLRDRQPPRHRAAVALQARAELVVEALRKLARGGVLGDRLPANDVQRPLGVELRGEGRGDRVAEALRLARVEEDALHVDETPLADRRPSLPPLSSSGGARRGGDLAHHLDEFGGARRGEVGGARGAEAALVVLEGEGSHEGGPRT